MGFLYGPPPLLPPSLSHCLTRCLCVCARAGCVCVCARAGVKTSSPITVSDHSALCRWFPKSYRLTLMFAIDSLRGWVVPELTLVSSRSFPLPSFLFVFFSSFFPPFFSKFIVLKGRSVNRSPPPTRGSGTAACARTRTRQRLLSAWCVMSGRGHQQGKDGYTLPLVCFTLVGPRWGCEGWGGVGSFGNGGAGHVNWQLCGFWTLATQFRVNINKVSSFFFLFFVLFNLVCFLWKEDP